jgi:hypothetical protein
MNHPTVHLDRAALDNLLRESAILRIVTVLNLASLSVLELLECQITRQDINKALAQGVIAFDESVSAAVNPNAVSNILEEGGDYYVRFLSNKVRLTELGSYILETIEPEQERISSTSPTLSRSDSSIDGLVSMNQPP